MCPVMMGYNYSHITGYIKEKGGQVQLASANWVLRVFLCEAQDVIIFLRCN